MDGGLWGVLEEANDFYGGTGDSNNTRTLFFSILFNDAKISDGSTVDALFNQFNILGHLRGPDVAFVKLYAIANIC